MNWILILIVIFLLILALAYILPQILMKTSMRALEIAVDELTEEEED